MPVHGLAARQFRPNPSGRDAVVISNDLVEF